MRRTKILNADEVRRKPFSEAKNEFVKHCRIKNLRPKTVTYYEEDIHYRRLGTDDSKPGFPGPLWQQARHPWYLNHDACR